MSIHWSHRLERAIRWAAAKHEGQHRKVTDIPYIEHPMAVAMLLDRAGFGEDVIIAGLLHDVVEDTDASLDEVRERFGDVVATLVDGCSEIKVDPTGSKRTWSVRKREHLEHVRTAPVGTRAIVLADKLHNLTCIEMDLGDGHPVWSNFNASRRDVLGYYKASLEACSGEDPRLQSLSESLNGLIERVEAMEENGKISN